MSAALQNQATAAPAIEVVGLRKRYGAGDTAVDALKGVDLTVQPGEVIGLIAEQPTAVVNHDRCPGIGAHPCGAGSQVESQRMTEQDFLVPGLYGQCPVVCDEVQPAQVDGVALQLHLQTVHASSGRDRQHRALRPHALQRGAGAVGNRRTERH